LGTADGASENYAVQDAAYTLRRRPVPVQNTSLAHFARV